MKKESAQRFVSESIKPLARTADAGAMVRGEPGLPRAFQWRDQQIRVERVIRTWRDTGPCTHGSSEQYVRKHWFEIRTGDHRIARIYFDRQPRSPRRTERWWLFSIGDASSETES